MTADQGYAFAGPGTNLTRLLERHTSNHKRSSIPINNIDAAALRHDTKYGDAYIADPKPENKKQHLKRIHDEDHILIDSVRGQRADDPKVAYAIEHAIRLKKLGETIGV